MDWLNKLRGLSGLYQFLIWAGLYIIGTLLSRLAMEIDWYFGFRTWFYTFLLTSLCFVLAEQFLIWAILDTNIWIKVLASIVSLVVSAVTFLFLLYIGSYGGWRGVPAG